MSGTPDLNFIGQRLAQIQAEQRSLRDDNRLIRAELGRLTGEMVTRTLLSEIIDVLVNRVANFEALMETHMTALEDRTTRIESGIAEILQRLPRAR